MAHEHTGFTVWLTGLSGAGKTTLAIALEQALRARGLHRVERLDGDTVREGLSRDLGFSREDRDRNIERVTFVARLLARNDVAVIAAFISPYRQARDAARSQIANFVEVYVAASLETCIQRDTKGLYARAIAGEIPHFTGISDPYEAPTAPEVIVQQTPETVEQSLARVLGALEARGLIPQAQPAGEAL